ncbi:MAG: hypothetical protein OXI63_17970 [Candidatus Poribacteria bacterium]|nr:hypothetical protein [Candidatus Poribacteria bacterium]
MAKYIQPLLFGLSIWLILNSWTVSADTATPKHYYDFPSDPEGQRYHRFFPGPAPEGLFYDTRQKVIANIDDTPEKETIVSIVADSGHDAFAGNWSHAFLLILDETETNVPKKKAFFRFLDSATSDLDTPAKAVEFQKPPFVFNLGSYPGHGIPFKLVDLTGDGILDVWFDLGEAIAVISFQNGEFKVVFSYYMNPRHQSSEYVDLDNDGIYEIKIPYSIYMVDLPGVRYLRWISLYKWDGNTYVLNNERFYAENDEFLIALLGQYNDLLVRYGRYEPYSFYLGLVFYYRGNAAMARKHLQWVVEHAEKRDYPQTVKAEDYIQAAEFLLKKLAKSRR